MRSGLLFADFFYGLRLAGVPVALSEWMGLLQALAQKAVPPDLTDFYHVARALLVKSETYFDAFDQVFTHVFGGGADPANARKITEELLRWLQDPKHHHGLSPEELAAFRTLPLEDIKRLFAQRLLEQTERHDGGNRWIGTGGTSPFGHSGTHPGGIRVGGQGGNRTAAQIASARQFKEYRNDRVLDTRNVAIALKKLRRLKRHAGEPELDIEASVDRTCKNAGELTLSFHPPRKNQSRVVLLMDVGGSMDPFVERVETLFSAASAMNHWRQFVAYEFHNCPYDRLYHNQGSRYWPRESVSTPHLLRTFDPETFLIIVGDASMAPSELSAIDGNIDYDQKSQITGEQWLLRLRNHFKHSVWLNPMPKDGWFAWSLQRISQIFPMFPLTLAGLEQAIDALLKKSHFFLDSN